jgi:hypothetical protein
MERMAGNGTATFANPDDYQAGIGGASVNLIVTGGGDFKVRLTRLNLRHLHAFSCSEKLPRIAYISLQRKRAFGDIVLHSRGERMHQRTNGESQWGLISLPPEQLATCGKALTGLKITSPRAGRVLRPSRSIHQPAARRII